MGWLLAASSRSISHAGHDTDLCARCAPLAVRAITEETEFFLARTEVEAMKAARELAYRIASERVVRKVEQSPLQCPRDGCVPGREEVTAGIDQSRPCRRGSLSDAPRNRKRARQRLARWRKACVEALGPAAGCDDEKLQRAKPAWAECSVEVWAKKTRTCAPARCQAPSRSR